MPASYFSQDLDRFLRACAERIESEADTQEAFAFAAWLATYLWKNTTGIYRFDSLEEALARRFTPQAWSHQIDAPPADELHVASEVYAFGGHTALMRQLMHESDGRAHALLAQMSDTQQAATRLNWPISQVHTLPLTDRATHQDRVAALTQYMQGFKRVILHIHPNDIDTAVAVRLLRTSAPHVQVYLLNHADHAFSVGIGAVHHVLEISHYGWSLRDKRRTNGTSSFVGIPIDIPEPPAQPSKNTDSVQLLTGGSAFKYRPQAGFSLPRAFWQILSERPRYHIAVIGPNSRNWWWWPLRLRFPKRVTIRKLVPKETYNQLLNACTVYVDSHPLLGGTAFPEALLKGCKVAGIRGLAWGYSPTDELLSDDAQALLRHCDALARSEHAALKAQQNVRLHCIEAHTPSFVRARLDQLIRTGQPVAPQTIAGSPPSSQRMENAWLTAGEIYVPTSKECPLSARHRKWLFMQYLALHGLWNKGAWRLMRYAVRRTS